MVIYELKTMQKCEIKEENTVVALGTFDGCHIGHAAVLRETFYKAKGLGIKSLAYTFDTPCVKGQECILTLDEKIRAIKRFGIDYIAVEDFDGVKGMGGEEFVSNVLMGTLNARAAVCGFNYRFGKGASCDCQSLKEFFEKSGGSVQICGQITHNGTVVSSTLIRSNIRNGKVEELLDYMAPYSVYAVVEKGKGLGKSLGIATINQKIPCGKVVPKTGVYITECEIGEDVYPCVTNVGYRPTTDGENDKLNVETHIIGYNGDLYYSCLRVNFYKYIREEKSFSTLEELIAQIEADKKVSLEYFGYRQ